jgi:hypothetical protein
VPRLAADFLDRNFADDVRMGGVNLEPWYAVLVDLEMLPDVSSGNARKLSWCSADSTP